MPGTSYRGAAYVSCHTHRLPACFSRAVTAVCKLTSPASGIPPLASLCTAGLLDYSAREGEAFSAAASGLHPRHQLPFVLSRVAASKAIASLSPCERSTDPKKKGRPPVVFADRREAAPALHGCRLSISHEDSVAASVAWPLSSSNTMLNDCNAAPTSLDDGGKLSCSVAASLYPTAASFAYAIDVVNVAEVHRVRSRFPLLGQRWVPQCATAACAEDVRYGLACLQKQQQTCVTEAKVQEDIVGGEGVNTRKAADRRDKWWAQLPTPCVSEADAFAAVVLAQHWGARECAVKLVGIPGRSFAYECVRALSSRGGGPFVAESATFTVSFMGPHTLYCAEVSGVEASAFAQQGLQSLLFLYTWTEWLPLSTSVDLPYVVVLACAPCLLGER
ncbi:hypothetical protein GH5_03034 [Leishmania sp. Ghana 2012 LV757]|uniref:hypothetical protein n=1 Tax=Leishmania sp. Ghana 2012 LV757 TaxID=2803181 RepID=UPI001B49A381|nr:hypothetical protein GH5_03034 [Leishmania sp. Ghana 2012 LV757]